jgi:phosphoribosylformylglycinamidine cyclo-ligase
VGERDHYSAAGVDYDWLDTGKRDALAAAVSTSHLLAARGGLASEASRGESAFVFQFGGGTLAFVIEGLGTKSVIANEYYRLTGVNRFDAVAVDAVAAIVNDLICVGALPLVLNAYFATGGSDWYRDRERAAALVAGWQSACVAAGCAWGGGESPGLSGLVAEDEIELAGSAVGALPLELAEPLLGQRLAPGDEIVVVQSSGLHSNGASLARAVSATHPDGLLAKLPDGSRLGDGLLTPSIIYVPLVARALGAGLDITYMSHITGHGYLKLMRAQHPLTYRMTALPPVPPVLQFLVDATDMSQREAYRTLNMGAGFALYCRPGAGDAVAALAEDVGLAAAVMGVVEEGSRQVLIEPLGLRYEQRELQFAA